jgi:hypothetical protein
LLGQSGSQAQQLTQLSMIWYAMILFPFDCLLTADSASEDRRTALASVGYAFADMAEFYSAIHLRKSA